MYSFIPFRTPTLAAMLVFVAFTKRVYTQQPPPTSRIAIQHDNDFVYAIDRYYSAGTFITYSKTLASDFMLIQGTKYQQQFDVTLGQLTYTPRELFDLNYAALERPFAGYLFVRGKLSAATPTYLFSIKGELGLAGPQSLAGKFQRGYHILINEFIPSWFGEIDNSFHLNAYGTFVYDLAKFSNPINGHLTFESQLALGSREVFIEEYAYFFFGLRSPLHRSASFGRISPFREWYGFISGGYRYVLRNALIEGNPLGDDSPFTLAPTSSIFSFKGGMAYSGLKNTFSIAFIVQGKETEREGPHYYMEFGVSRQF